jgi:hypothetical protein
MSKCPKFSKPAAAIPYNPRLFNAEVQREIASFLDRPLDVQNLNQTNLETRLEVRETGGNKHVCVTAANIKDILAVLAIPNNHLDYASFEIKVYDRMLHAYFPQFLQYVRRLTMINYSQKAIVGEPWRPWSPLLATWRYMSDKIDPSRARRIPYGEVWYSDSEWQELLAFVRIVRANNALCESAPQLTYWQIKISD